MSGVFILLDAIWKIILFGKYLVYIMLHFYTFSTELLNLLFIYLKQFFKFTFINLIIKIKLIIFSLIQFIYLFKSNFIHSLF